MADIVERLAEKGASPSKLTSTQQRLLGYIAEKTMTDGAVCCSKEELACRVHCSVKTIDRALVSMRQSNLIEVKPRFHQNGGQLSNMYRLAR